MEVGMGSASRSRATSWRMFSAVRGWGGVKAGVRLDLFDMAFRRHIVLAQACAEGQRSGRERRAVPGVVNAMRRSEHQIGRDKGRGAESGAAGLKPPDRSPRQRLVRTLQPPEIGGAFLRGPDRRHQGNEPGEGDGTWSHPPGRTNLAPVA
jgi:hypothetical protein